MNFDQHPLDPRVRRFVRPERIVWQSAGSPAIENIEALLQPNGRPVRMKHGGEAPGFVVDFGREIHGGLRIENFITPDQAPVRVRVRFGESVSEAMGVPNNDHAIHDQTTLVPWYGHAELGNTGFRFARIDLVDPDSEIDITDLRAVFLYRDIPYIGSFNCSDPLLNRIWQTGAYTVHLCMQDMLWDGIKRDRLVWVGDMHPEMMVINTVFGEHPIVPESLDYIRNRTPLPGWMNGISSYSLWWVVIHHAWFQYHGNMNYLAGQKDYLLPLLERLRSQIGEDDSEALEGHRFLDWPTSENPAAIHAGLQGLLSWALTAGAELCHILQEEDEQHRCLAAASRLTLHTPAPTTSKQANALLVVGGLADAGDVNKRILAQDPFHGLSTFYGYYVLQARALAGDHQGCLDVIRRYWGKMLELGATTFWEHFELDWAENAVPIDQLVPEGKKDLHAECGDYCYKGLRHSLCHGWAAGPTAWLTEHVLGVKPIEPGCATVLINPHLGDLDFAEGTMPTPYGPLRVRHEKSADGKVETTVDAPDEVGVLTR